MQPGSGGSLRYDHQIVDDATFQFRLELVTGRMRVAGIENLVAELVKNPNGRRINTNKLLRDVGIVPTTALLLKTKIDIETYSRWQ